MGLTIAISTTGIEHLEIHADERGDAIGHGLAEHLLEGLGMGDVGCQKEADGGQDDLEQAIPQYVATL
jgi:hypothetical protein